MPYRTVFETDEGDRYEWEIEAQTEQDAESQGRLKTMVMAPTRTINTVEVEEL